MQAVPALTKPRSGDRSFHANVCSYLLSTLSPGST